MENILEINSLNKKLKGFALKNISFKLPKGYIMGFIGPNGAGKSTTIRCIMDLLRPDSGDIQVFGKTHQTATKEIKQRIGFVYDESHFYEDYSLEKNMKILAPFYETWDRSAFQKYINEFNLPLKKKLKTLSKGMKMKFSLAMALSHHPDLLIMDEPTAGLDPVFRRELLDILRDIIQDEEKSIFFSTHITTDLEQIADYITFIHNGEIIFSKELEEVFEKYAVVKAPLDFAPELGGVLVGMTKTAVGVKGLVTERSAIPASLIEKITVERATLEDIMYFTTRGR